MKAEYGSVPGQDWAQARRSLGARLAAIPLPQGCKVGAGKQPWGWRRQSAETLLPLPNPSEQQPQATAGPETPADAVRDTN